MAKNGKPRWTTAVPTQEEQYDLKRLALIREAGRAFSRKGFHNTSMEEVAAILNVTKPALYYYVKTKQEILYECHSYSLDLGERARQIAFAASEKPIERLRSLLFNYIELLTSSFDAYTVLAEPISSLDPIYRERIVRRLRDFDRLFQNLIKDAIADGSLPACDPRLAIAFFMGAINTITRWYSPDGPRQSREIAQAFVGFIMNGLLGAPASAAELREIKAGAFNGTVSEKRAARAGVKVLAGKTAPTIRTRPPRRPTRSGGA